MAQPTYAARLRYLPASEIDDSDVDFDGLDVRGHDNEKLGDTDGFIVNADTGRVFYVVVDSGGWFSSRRFLLPVGHTTVDRTLGALCVDVSRDALQRYPEFQRDRFENFSDEDLRAFETRMSEACCPDDPLEDTSAGMSYFDTRRHYTQPAWWAGAASAARSAIHPVDAVPGRAASSVREQYDRDLITARDRSGDDLRADRESRVTRDEDTRRDDASPHLGGRAQPGDVLGLETGGERTSVGDTAEDENERRRKAERDAPPPEEPRRSER